MLVSEPFIPQAKLMKVINLIQRLHGEPKTVKELSEDIEMSQRTIYRYLHLIIAVGVELKETYVEHGHQGPDKVKYSTNGECPFCGKNVDK